jgi:hypothetical protein
MKVYVWEEEYDGEGKELKHVFANRPRVLAALYNKNAEIDDTLSHGNNIVAWIECDYESFQKTYIKVIITEKDVE